MQPKVSVIVPIYKVESYLMQCLDSIVNQTIGDIEVILVDEGERDQCFAIMMMYAKEDARVKLIHKKCGGYGAAVNRGIEAATGEYISIVESDDFIELTMLDEMYRHAKALDVDVVKTPYFEFYEANNGRPEYKILCDYADAISKTLPKCAFKITDYPNLMAVHASVWCGLYRRRMFTERGLRFVEAKGAAYVDVLFRIRSFVEADNIAWLNRALYNYRMTNMSSSTNRFDLDSMLSRWEEAHDYFDKKCPDVYTSVGPFLIFDEYWNTWGYLEFKSVSDEQYIRMRNLLGRVGDVVLKKSCLLKVRQRQVLERLKKYSSAKEFNHAFILMPSIRRIRDVFYRGLAIDAVFRHNLIRLHIMEGIARPIFGVTMSVSGRWCAELIVGHRGSDLPRQVDPPPISRKPG